MRTFLIRMIVVSLGLMFAQIAPAETGSKGAVVPENHLQFPPHPPQITARSMR